MHEPDDNNNNAEFFELAAGLPRDSLLAAEFTSVARSIDVAGVLGTWRLDGLARELGEDAE